LQQLVESGVSVVDGCLFLVVEGMLASICCRLVLASRSWSLLEVFGA